MYRHRIKKGKLFYLSFILIFIASFYITVGFSVFNSNVLMEDTELIIRVEKDMRITNLMVNGNNNGAYTNALEYNIENIYLDLDLPNSNSIARYLVSIKNYGNVEMGIKSITSSNPNIKLTTNNYKVGDLIRDNDNTCTNGNCKLNIDREFELLVSYNDGVYHDGMVTNFPNLIIDFEFDEVYPVNYRGFNEDLSSNLNYICKGSNLNEYIGSNLDSTNISVYRGDNLSNDFTYNSSTGYILVNNCQTSIDISYRSSGPSVNVSSIQEIQNAINNMGGSGTVTLSSDFPTNTQVSLNIPSGVDLTIDLNGLSLNTNGSPVLSFTGSGDVTIKSNGNSTLSSSRGILSLDNNYSGTVTLDGINGSTSNTFVDGIVNSSPSATIILKDCTIDATRNGNPKDLFAGVTNTSSGSIELINCNVSGVTYAVRNTGSGMVTIDGGTYTCIRQSVKVGKTNVTTHAVESDDASKMLVKSGTFVGNGNYANNYKDTGTTCSGSAANYVCTK